MLSYKEFKDQPLKEGVDYLGKKKRKAKSFNTGPIGTMIYGAIGAWLTLKIKDWLKSRKKAAEEEEEKEIYAQIEKEGFKYDPSMITTDPLKFAKAFGKWIEEPENARFRKLEVLLHGIRKLVNWHKDGRLSDGQYFLKMMQLARRFDLEYNKAFYKIDLNEEVSTKKVTGPEYEIVMMQINKKLKEIEDEKEKVKRLERRKEIRKQVRDEMKGK